MSSAARSSKDRLRTGAVAAGAFVERRSRWLLAGLLAALAVAAVVIAAHKPLWNDELFTYYISELPAVRDMWDTLATGVEQTPLTFYLAARGSLAVFGDSGVALRLPELAGYLLMSVCVYLFVSRRTSALYGLVAVLFPVATIAYGYAYEARAYGLVLGFAAASLLCWQLAAEGGPRHRLAALGTAASLAAAVASHYYAVLLLLPLVAGETARTLARRRVDWLVWGSFAGVLVPLLGFQQLIRDAADYSTTFWGRPTLHGAIRFYPDSLMDRELGLVAGAVVVLAATALLHRPSRVARADRLARPPDHELIALVTLALLPFLGVVLGKLVTDAYTDRYVLSAVIAFAVLLALSAWWVDNGVPVIGVALLLVLSLFGGARIASRYADAGADARDQAAALRLLRDPAAGGPPIVVASPHDFFELSHRVSREGGPSLIYLADPRLAQRYLGTDAVELGVVGMSDIAPLRVVAYRRFMARHRRFEVYGRNHAWDWLTAALSTRGVRFRVLAGDLGSGRVLREAVAPPSP